MGVSASRIGGGSTASASIAIKRCPSSVQAHDGLLKFSWTNTRMLSSTRGAGQSHARCVLARLLVSDRFEPRPRDQVGVSIDGCHPPLKYDPTRARRGK